MKQPSKKKPYSGAVAIMMGGSVVSLSKEDRIMVITDEKGVRVTNPPTKNEVSSLLRGKLKGYKYLPDRGFFVPTPEVFYEKDKNAFRNPGPPYQHELVSLINRIQTHDPERRQFWSNENNKARLYAAIMNDTGLMSFTKPDNEDVIHIELEETEELILKRAETMFLQDRETEKVSKGEARKQFENNAREEQRKKHSTKKPDERYIDPIQLKIDGKVKTVKAGCDQLYGNEIEGLNIYQGLKEWCSGRYSLKDNTQLRRAAKKLNSFYPKHTPPKT